MGMIKLKQFRDKWIEPTTLFGSRKLIEPSGKCLEFANKIEKEGCKVINISVNFNPAEFVYTVFYRTKWGELENGRNNKFQR